MPAGYLAVLQTPQPAFCSDAVQWHDVSIVQSRPLCRLYATQQEVKYAPEVASYTYCVTCVVFGSLSWGTTFAL